MKPHNLFRCNCFPIRSHVIKIKIHLFLEEPRVYRENTRLIYVILFVAWSGFELVLAWGCERSLGQWCHSDPLNSRIPEDHRAINTGKVQSSSRASIRVRFVKKLSWRIPNFMHCDTKSCLLKRTSKDWLDQSFCSSSWDHNPYEWGMVVVAPSAGTGKLVRVESYMSAWA